MNFADRAYGLDSLPSEVSLEVGNFKSQGTVYLSRPKIEKQSLESIPSVNRIKAMKSKVFQERQAGPGERKDGWIEIKLGYFYRDGNFSLPLPTSPHAGSPRHAKVVVRGWGKILALHHRARQG